MQFNNQDTRTTPIKIALLGDSGLAKQMFLLVYLETSSAWSQSLPKVYR